MAKLVEMTVEEAMKIVGGKAKVLVAVQNLEDEDCSVCFKAKKKEDYPMIFEDIKTVASICDDFINQLNCYTAKQDLKNIKPLGVRKIVLIE